MTANWLTRNLQASFILIDYTHNSILCCVESINIKLDRKLVNQKFGVTFYINWFYTIPSYIVESINIKLDYKLVNQKFAITFYINWFYTIPSYIVELINIKLDYKSVNQKFAITFYINWFYTISSRWSAQSNSTINNSQSMCTDIY